MISHQFRFVFVHAGRTGGSSLERLAGQPITSDPRTMHTGNTDFPEKHKGFQYYRTAFPREFESYFRFTIVRNPFSRLVSAWIWQRDVAQVTRAETFRDFIESRPEEHAFARKFKLDGLSPEESIKRFDHVGRFEEIGDSFRFICDRTGLRHADLVVTNRTLAGPYRSFYDEETVALVRKRYALDLELFGYDF